MLKFLKRWNQRRVTRRELYSLDSRELRDLGINRCDIERIVSEI